MSVTGAIVAGVGAAGALGGAALSSSAAGNAASTQANAADEAAQLQYQAEQNSLGFQENVWNQQQQDLAPWLQSGAGALTTLDSLMGLNAPNIPANYGVPNTSTPGAAPSPFGGSGNYVPMGSGAYFNTGGSPATGTPATPPVQGTAIPSKGNMVEYPGATGSPIMSGTYPYQMPGKGTPASPTAPASAASTPSPGLSNGQLQPFAPWTQQFQAPTDVTEQNDPGYQFRLQQGTQAVQNSAAASGDLLSGNTLAGLTQYGQNYASNEYQNVYNRALQQYQQQYNIYQNNQANQWNRLASMAGIGQTAVNQLNSAGSTAAQNYGNTVIGSTNAIGQNLNNAAAATASGYVGSANAYGGALGSLGNLGAMIPYLNLLNQGGGGSQVTTGTIPGIDNSLYTS
jgi:hypothetical protein